MAPKTDALGNFGKLRRQTSNEDLGAVLDGPEVHDALVGGAPQGGTEVQDALVDTPPQDGPEAQDNFVDKVRQALEQSLESGEAIMAMRPNSRGRSTDLTEAERGRLRVEQHLAEAAGLSWQERGTQESNARFWRGQKCR